MWCKALIKAALCCVFFFFLLFFFLALDHISRLKCNQNDCWKVTYEKEAHTHTQTHIYTHTPTQGRNFPELWDVWEILMKAARVATNEEDGPSVKQNDEKQLSEGDVTLPFLSPFISVCVLSPSRKHTQTHTYTNPAPPPSSILTSKPPLLKMC